MMASPIPSLPGEVDNDLGSYYDSGLFYEICLFMSEVTWIRAGYESHML